MGRCAIVGLVHFCAFFAVSVASAGAAEPGASPASPNAAVRRVLLLTGEDYPGHLWRTTTPVLQSQLAKDRRLAVTVVDDLKTLRTLDLKPYAAVVAHFKNYDPKVPGPEGYENLNRYVRRGGGLTLVHFTCGAFQERPEFVELAGRVWNPKLRGHDPIQKFRVEITDPKHPITQGLQPFEIQDELYTCLDGAVPIRVLATSVSSVDRKKYPMAFVLEVERGRVFHCPLGHDVKALSNEACGELLRRGVAWTAGLPLLPAKKPADAPSPAAPAAPRTP